MVAKNLHDKTDNLRKKVLLIEDDAWFAESVVDTLRSDFDVRCCGDVAGGLDALDAWRPDVIVSDVVIGAKNVFELLHEMQSYDDLRAIPVLLLSSFTDKVSVNSARQYGVVNVLDKAIITPENLRNILRNLRTESNMKMVQNG